MGGFGRVVWFSVGARSRGVLGTLLCASVILTSAAAAGQPPPSPLPHRLGLHVRGETTSPGPPVVLLHGICGEPRNSCAVFSELGAGELVCARADLSCPNGGAMWSGGSNALRRIEAAVTSAASESAGRIDPTAPRLLVGFSQGAYVAVRAARGAPGVYPSLLLVGAFVKPTRAELESAGITRVAFAAGELDAAATTMRESAARLRAEGFDATYFSLGHVGHTYVAENPRQLADAVAWSLEAVSTRGLRASN